MTRVRLTPKKKMNETVACMKRKERELRVLEQKVENAKRKLEELGRMHAQYAIENVKKREARSAKARKELRQQRDEAKKQAKASEKELEKLRTKKTMVHKKPKKRLVRAKKSKKGVKKGQKTMRCSKTRRGLEGRKTCIEVEVEEKLEPDELEMKEKDGSYKEEVRMGVLELAGLEVATGKMADVMRTVGEMCGVKFSNLPTRSACQDMIDEGHVIAKKYIWSRLLGRSNTFGVHKDGTTAGGADNEMIDVWMRLNYLMNDRAANEKKGSRILDEWRDEYLRTNGQAGSNKIHHLYCCAHVLLGFHTYVMQEVRKLPGLESGEEKHPVTRMLRDAGDVFVGDHRGVRNLWEAYCLEKKIKSTMKSYKDNRFNGLFEISAQVFHHQKEFLHILDSLNSKNAKLTRLTNSLHNPTLIILIECLGLFFHKITGPFWTMVVSKKTNFTIFRATVRSLKESLEKFSKNPAAFFDENKFDFLPFSTSDETKGSLSTGMKDGMSDVIRALSTGMVTAMKAHLKDFMEDGAYGREEEVRNIPQTAPLTNLVCERHFGHLDSSQKRRPSSTLHHHSSIILLKQTRKGIKDWYWQQSSAERKALWKASRKEMNSLRRKHVAQDRKAVVGSLMRVKLLPLPKALDIPLKKGQMVAVACEDNWYPAMVEADSEGMVDVSVNFAELGKTLGTYRWGRKKDAHKVSRGSILETELDVEPRAGGRIYFIRNAAIMQDAFSKSC